MKFHLPQASIPQRLSQLPPFLRRKSVITGLILFFILCLIPSQHGKLPKRKPYTSPSDSLKSTSHHSFDVAEIDLHLLIPATSPNLELCKGLLSAAVLGYPPPTLINWGREFIDTSVPHNGSHIGKITGVVEYLDGILYEHVNQLLLMVDGYDLWFQLPLPVLHARFRGVGRRLADATADRYGGDVVEREGLFQQVIFSADKTCGPGHQQLESVACYGQPPSPMRADLYGDDTDVRDEPTRLPLHMRPAFLNSGFIVGTVEAMKRLMLRAKEKSEGSEGFKGSDQRVFNEIFGEQEYVRELLRQRHRGLGRKVVDGVKGVLGMREGWITDAHPSHKPAGVALNDGKGPYEYGIGLDYGLELVQSMVLSEFDGRFLTFGNEEEVMEVLSSSGLPVPPRVDGLPADIADEASLGVDWLTQGLYTNMWTGSVPLAIHMNGMKAMRKTLWGQMWYNANAREMLRQREGKIAKTPAGETLSWSEVCGMYESELFGGGTQLDIEAVR